MRKYFTLTVCIILLCSGHIWAYDEEITHRNITLQAARDPRKGIDNYLKQNLGFENGLKTRLPSNNIKTVLYWLRQGSFDEDHPICRASSHFHNPLKPWDQSYMSDDPFYINAWCSGTEFSTRYSNVTWGTGYLSPTGSPITRPNQDMGWDNAREYYYWALTSVSNTGRDLFFTKTFRALSQVLHLLQDVSVPAHVRNDFTSHLAFIGFNSIKPTSWFGNRFEYYVKNKSTLIFNSAPDFPSFTNPLVTDFWDTEQYIGNNPSKSLLFGLSEFTNANYFSDWTIPNNNPTPEHLFTYPMVNSTNVRICEDYAQNSTEIRKYVSRTECPPLTIQRSADHFAAVSLINEESMITNENISSLSLMLDENVHDTYAKELLPRAVGYSAGLLDYFFRGNIAITLPDTGVYAQTENRDEGFKKVTLRAQNTSPAGEEMPNGSIELVVKYRLAQEDPFQSYPVPTTWEYSYIVVPELNGIRSIPRASPIKLEFDLSQNPIPINATDIYLQVVYRGKLGQEEGAVAAGFKDISEPTPIDVYDDMDRICINGSWYVAGSPEAIAQVDTNHNGIADWWEWDVYPHDLKDIYIRLSPITDTDPKYASSTEYNLHIPSLSAGEFFIRRAFILSDYQFNYSDKVGQVVNKDPNDPFVSWFETEVIPYTGIKNQTEYVVLEEPQECAVFNLGAPCGIYWRYYPIFNSFRGQEMWKGVVFPNASYPPGSSCP